ncbi:MAG: HEAT repeat domain-containing protein [Deltaproteobacteria bacterium]|nr:HEAT repeat domain-containing protein [Deltaproteobacteria bacterium]MBI3387329.1 HEAT repeat domain-containing protein [Deltaproteobacteria bacterium]
MTAPDALNAIARLGTATSASVDDVAFLIAHLGDPRKLVQRRAAEALAVLAQAGVLVRPALLQALDDAQLPRRWGAAYALARIGPPPPAAIATLIEVMGSNDGDLRWAAADILKRLGPQILPPVIGIASSGNPPQRKMALYCLRDLAISSVEVDSVITTALTDVDVGVRLAGLSALVRVTRDAPAAVAWVVRLARDADAGVRRAAMSALGSLGHCTVEVKRIVIEAAQTSNDPGLRRAAERTMRMLQLRPPNPIR